MDGEKLVVDSLFHTLRQVRLQQWLASLLVSELRCGCWNAVCVGTEAHYSLLS